MGFGRNPADYEERWAMAKERTRLIAVADLWR